jgi:DNA-binding transcriptional LysR family regulator
LPEVIRRYRAARPGVELHFLELTSIEQITALKEGRIDVGFGRIPLDDPAVKRLLLRNGKRPLTTAVCGAAQALTLGYFVQRQGSSSSIRWMG